MLRDAIKQALVTAMKAKDEKVTGTLRMVQATIKNKDIELRTGVAPEAGSPAEDAMIADILQKMIKQRRESVTLYDQGNRPELADAERQEIAIIEQFLPRQMDEAEAAEAIKALVTELGASSVKDMGKVMAALKERFAGQMDMSAANALVKAALAG